MDRELAGAVLQRWQDGLPVAETAFYKAAAVMGMDPAAALEEARFYTHLDSFLMEKRAMTPEERRYFSAAAGVDHRQLVKTASRYRLDEESLILRQLEQRNWVPDLQGIFKLAFIAANAGPTDGPSMDMEGVGGPQPPAAPEEPEQPGQQGQPGQPGVPDPGAQLQQAPPEMIQPSPTGPPQMAPSPEGNLDELLQQAGQAQGADMGGGLPPGGMGAQEPPPPPPTPEERIQQSAPNLPPDAIPRYAQKLTELEQQTGIPVSDPKQITKFVQQLQKADSKIIDQAIKTMAEQQKMEAEQQTAQVQQQAQQQRMQQAAAGPPPQQAQPGQQADALAKVAHAARVMARAKLRHS
jgi:ribosomal protein L12E/L44/L45/RPP1/RPP2